MSSLSISPGNRLEGSFISGEKLDQLDHNTQNSGPNMFSDMEH